MELSKLKSGLLHTIEEYNGKTVGVGELRVDLMARDCFNAIQELETENAKLHFAPANDPLTLEQLWKMDDATCYHTFSDNRFKPGNAVVDCHLGYPMLVTVYGKINARYVIDQGYKIYARKPEGSR